jgi:DNA-binding transcriptional LysR family regulator
MAEAAIAGNGLAWLPADMVRGTAGGRLLTTLNDWEITFPGYHLYYASRRSSSALSLVVDALRLPQS